MAEITLQTPVKRKDDQIKKVTLRQPSAGELRGLSLARLMQMDVSAIITVVPRISQPILDEAEVAALGPVDFAAIAQEVVGFFFSEADRKALEAGSL
ncbi:MAG TPA: phage tail assembly protein [Roseovarius sp.]|jgi:hypothetical protein|nr:phage tail assembly protein [Roseovarius sp.]